MKLAVKFGPRTATLRASTVDLVRLLELAAQGAMYRSGDWPSGDSMRAHYLDIAAEARTVADELDAQALAYRQDRGI